MRRVLKPGGLFLSANFMPATWGYALGTRVSRNTFTDIPEGPLAERGLGLFMERDQLDELHQGVDDVIVDKLSWTTDGMKHVIELWLVTCRTPS